MEKDTNVEKTQNVKRSQNALNTRNLKVNLNQREGIVEVDAHHVDAQREAVEVATVKENQGKNLKNLKKEENKEVVMVVDQGMLHQQDVN